MNKTIKILIAILALLVVIVVIALGAFGEKSNMISEKEVAKYKSAAKAASVLTVLQGLKAQIGAVYVEQMKLPESLSSMGMSEESMGKIRYIDKILVKDGSIFADVKSEFGKGSIISLIPKKIMDGAALQWSCETNIQLQNMDYCVYNINMKSPFAIEGQAPTQ